jgi:hypothetical protein
MAWYRSLLHTKTVGRSTKVYHKLDGLRLDLCYHLSLGCITICVSESNFSCTSYRLKGTTIRNQHNLHPAAPVGADAHPSSKRNPHPENVFHDIPGSVIVAELSLERTVRSCVADLQDKHPEMTVRIFPAPDHQVLPEEVRLAPFRVLHQSLTNTIRRANATEIRIRFSLGAEESRLKVSNSGKGFQVPQPGSSLFWKPIRDLQAQPRK